MIYIGKDQFGITDHNITPQVHLSDDPKLLHLFDNKSTFLQLYKERK